MNQESYMNILEQRLAINQYMQDWHYAVILCHFVFLFSFVLGFFVLIIFTFHIHILMYGVFKLTWFLLNH